MSCNCNLVAQQTPDDTKAIAISPLLLLAVSIFCCCCFLRILSPFLGYAPAACHALLGLGLSLAQGINPCRMRCVFVFPHVFLSRRVRSDFPCESDRATRANQLQPYCRDLIRLFDFCLGGEAALAADFVRLLEFDFSGSRFDQAFKYE